ncbi:MAG: hypothetical protein GC154_09085 [bacterium]|nr:hypothetical protein [bacterium]
MRQRVRSQKSDFQLFLEFIGLKTIIGLSVFGGVYFYSGYRNYMTGRSMFDSFSPYYALRMHDGGRLLSELGRWSNNQIKAAIEVWSRYWAIAMTRLGEFAETQLNPFLEQNPVLGFVIMGIAGFLLCLTLFYLMMWMGRRIYGLFDRSYSPRSRAAAVQVEDWTFDPRRTPSDDQIRIMTRNLEKLVHRAPALAGQVPKNADFTIKELAKRSQDSDFVYRNAVYVMGPIKGTGLDNSYDLPLTLDQVKKVSTKMGRSAVYETLPLDMVTLAMKKGSSKWEVAGNVDPVSLGRSYPIKVLERVMLQNRNYFIWDNRAKKSVTGYKVR